MRDRNRSWFMPALRQFKADLCDENKFISEILRTHLRKHLVAPILDVGAGLGDIAEAAYPELEAVLLDIEEMPQVGSPRHARVTGDFYNYPTAPNPPRTIIFSHVLQYLDDDIDKLADKISEINPDIIIDVANDNTGVFGDIVSWSLDACAGANPELKLNIFECIGYRLVEQHQFTATLHCSDFTTMAKFIARILLDAPENHDSKSIIEQMLIKWLPSPQLPINETVYCYARKDKG